MATMTIVGKEPAMARMIQYPYSLHIGVIGLEPPWSGEAYLIVIKNKEGTIVADQPASWQGLIGTIQKAVHVKSGDAIIPESIVDGRHGIETLVAVPIPPSIIEAAGVRSARFYTHTTDFDPKRQLGFRDLLYIRANVSRQV